MRVMTCVISLFATLVVALPAPASIKAMTLSELMSVTQDTIHGKITARETVRLSHPWPDAVYTQLTIVGENARTGEPQESKVVFHGSHEAADEYTISEMPTLQETRVGAEVIAFISKRKDMEGRYLLHNLGGVFRVERAFGKPVLQGKGPGFAFEKNEKLAVARDRVRQVHVEQLAAKKKQSLGPVR